MWYARLVVASDLDPPAAVASTAPDDAAADVVVVDIRL